MILAKKLNPLKKSCVLRVNWRYIKGFLLLLFVVTLFAFSTERNGNRKITEVKVNFIGNENLYVTEETVNKLLIQNEQVITNVPKEILDLNGLETALNSNPMIKSAEVYLAVNGDVVADIEQRKPIARVVKSTSFYIDDEGKKMPLSSNRSARVPLVTGFVDDNNLENVFTIAKRIKNDDFLKTHIIEIMQHENQTISLKTRVLDFEVLVGTLDHLDKKINNLKAFYQKAKKDGSLSQYSKVNLQFDNQVVCTKK